MSPTINNTSLDYYLNNNYSNSKFTIATVQHKYHLSHHNINTIAIVKMILVITLSPLKTQLYKIVVESFAFMQAFH